MASQGLDRVFQPRRIAKRKHVPVRTGVERIAVPVTRRTAGALDHRHERGPIIELETGLADNVEVA